MSAAPAGCRGRWRPACRSPGAHVFGRRVLAQARRPAGRRDVPDRWRALVSVQPAQGRGRAPARRHEEGGPPRPYVTRLRPGIVGQRAAGSAFLRYGVPGCSAGRAVLDPVPLLPSGSVACACRWCTPTTWPMPSYGHAQPRTARSTSPPHPRSRRTDRRRSRGPPHPHPVPSAACRGHRRLARSAAAVGPRLAGSRHECAAPGQHPRPACSRLDTQPQRRVRPAEDRRRSPRFSVRADPRAPPPHGGRSASRPDPPRTDHLRPRA